MTKIILLFSLFSSSAAFGAMPGLKCISEFPTTSFLLSEAKDQVTLTVIHHNGWQYMPVARGVLTPADIPMLQKRGEFFKRLGDRFTVTFQREKCNYEGALYYRCSLPKPSEINGQKVDMVYFNTSDSIDRIPEMGFQRTNVDLSIRVDTEEFRLESTYWGDDCRHED